MAHNEPTGTTFPDLILRLARRPIAWVFAGGVIAVVLMLVVSGVLTVTWDGSVIRLSSTNATPTANVDGVWHGEGKDIPGVLPDMVASYSYRLHLTIKQTGPERFAGWALHAQRQGRS